MSLLLARLRQHPLVRVHEERVRTRAYFLSLAGGPDPIANWHAAMDEEVREYVRAVFVWPEERGHAGPGRPFEAYYEPVFSWSADPSDPPRRPTWLGTKDPAKCSICGRSRPAVKFKTDAHVVPELTGTRALRTFDECDECNARAGREYETDLGNMLLADRSFATTPAKDGGTAKLKYTADGAFVGGQARGKTLVIGIKEGDSSVRRTFTGPNAVTFELKTPAFRPRRVVKALAKATWQALPRELRAEAEQLRKYVNDEIEWTISEFYRASIPSLSHVALGIWRRSSTADPALPPFVSLLSTSGNVMLWACPDLATGRYGAAILPGLPRLPGTTISLTKITAEGDARVGGGTATYELGFAAKALAFTQEPMPVRVTYISEGAAVSIDGNLTTPKGMPAADANEITYEIRSPDLIGVIRIERKPGEPGLEVHYSFDVAPRSNMDRAPTQRLLEALAGGSELRVEALDSDEPSVVAVASGGDRGDLDLRVLDDGLELAEQLAVVRDALGAELRFPSEIDNRERRTIRVLAEGIRRGRVRERIEGETEMPLTRDKASQFLDARSRGVALEVGGVNELPWQFLGQVFDPGPARLVLENVRIADEGGLADRVAALGDAEQLRVVVQFESLRHEFGRFLRDEITSTPAK